MNKRITGITIGGIAVGSLLALVLTVLTLQHSTQATGSPRTLPHPERAAPAAAPTSALAASATNGDTARVAFQQSLQQAIRAHQYDLLRFMMDQSFMIATWRGEGHQYAPPEAIAWLRTAYLVSTSNITFVDAERDLAALLGMDPLTLWGNPQPVQALYSTGWGTHSRGDAILLIGQTRSGQFYWQGILAAPDGFTTTAPSDTATRTDDDTDQTYAMLAYIKKMRLPLVILNDSVRLMDTIIISLADGSSDLWQQDATYLVQQMDSLASALPQPIPGVAQSTHAPFVDAMLACQAATEGVRLSLQQADPTAIRDPQISVYLNQCRASLDTYNAQVETYLHQQ